jgi:hypothetical protein
MMRFGWPTGRVLAPVVLAAAIASTAAGPRAVVDDVRVGGPSALLPYLSGASPYSGVGRYEGRATCTAFLLDTGLPADGSNAPAYALTSGHCPALSGSNDVLIDGDGVGRVVFNYFIDSERAQVPVAVARTSYATMKGRDLAVLELAASYRDLTGQLIRPWKLSSSGQVSAGEPVAIVGAPLSPDLGQSFLRVAGCQIDGVAPIVLEHLWHWFDEPFNRCQDILPGSSGSPAIALTDGTVIGIANTTTIGSAPQTDCALNTPCEPATGGGRARPDTTYLAPLAGIMNCFDVRRRFAVRQAGCPLDPGTQPQPAPSHVGPVNPFLATQPVGTVRRAWDIAVGGQGSYRYAVVTPPFDDCRTTRGYGNPVSAAALPSIDIPLPATEGFAFLCIISNQPVAYPTVVVARVDTSRPRAPAQVTVVETDDAWRVRFDTIGQEVAFHAYKAGAPAQTRCSDATGYRLAPATVISLPKSAGPYLLCAIPYDAAQNPGTVFERSLS